MWPIACHPLCCFRPADCRGTSMSPMPPTLLQQSYAMPFSSRRTFRQLHHFFGQRSQRWSLSCWSSPVAHALQSAGSRRQRSAAVYTLTPLPNP